MNKKIYICCPGDSVTGGPELLHQFCDALSENHVDASIIYYPFNKKFAVPKQYSHYNVSIENYCDIDQENAIFVVPEVATSLIEQISQSTICIWWMSVDNYFGRKNHNRFVQRYLGHAKSVLLRQRVPISAMKNYLHLSQSEYAKIFLNSKGIECDLLTDYLNDAHLNKVDELIKREDIICYNPKKGSVHSNRLISNFPKYKFVPIQNMTPSEVRNLLERSKVYIDFGPHPGKDRFPREAVMAGACVITGLSGSAKNSVDIPIPSCYKIDEFSKNFTNNFESIVEKIFHNYEECYTDFEGYKEKITNESEVFKSQVKLFSNKYCK